MSTDRRRGFLRVSEHQAQELERWAYPDYADEQVVPLDNAISYDPQWQPELLEEEEEQGPPPLTAADLEDIRHSAYEEGLAEGRAAGHAEGVETGKAEGWKQDSRKAWNKVYSKGWNKDRHKSVSMSGI